MELDARPKGHRPRRVVTIRGDRLCQVGRDGTGGRDDEQRVEDGPGHQESGGVESTGGWVEALLLGVDPNVKRPPSFGTRP